MIFPSANAFNFIYNVFFTYYRYITILIKLMGACLSTTNRPEKDTIPVSTQEPLPKKEDVVKTNNGLREI